MTLEFVPVEDEERASAWHSFFFELFSDLDPPETLEGLRRAPAVWQAQAACRGVGVDLFLPKLGEDVDPARAICARCDVRQEVPRLHHDGLVRCAPGVWGGATGLDWRRLKRASTFK